MKLIVDKEL